MARERAKRRPAAAKHRVTERRETVACPKCGRPAELIWTLTKKPRTQVVQSAGRIKAAVVVDESGSLILDDDPHADDPTLVCPYCEADEYRRLARESLMRERSPSNNLPPLDDNEQEIVEHLSQKLPALVLQAELRRSDKTAKQALDSLATKGLVHRPQGKRKGWTLTNRGIQVATALRRKPGD